MNYNEILTVIAKALYDEEDGLKGVWMEGRLGLCARYYDFAEAALRALQDKLSDVQDTGITIEDAFQNGQLYKELKTLGG